MPKYQVRYQVVYEGYTIVEAPNIYEAKDLVDEGEFEENKRLQQRVEWKAMGVGALIPGTEEQ